MAAPRTIAMFLSSTVPVEIQSGISQFVMKESIYELMNVMGTVFYLLPMRWGWGPPLLVVSAVGVRDLELYEGTYQQPVSMAGIPASSLRTWWLII